MSVSLRCRALLVCLCATLPLLGPAGPAGAQEGGGRPRRVSPEPQDAPADGGSVELRSDLVTVTVSVADAAGRAVAGLTPADFRVLEDARPQRIEHFEPVGDPYSLLLMVDTSGSAASEVERMRRAAGEFVAGLGPDDKLGVISFSRAINLHGRLTSDRRDLARQVGEIAPQRSASPRRGRYDESTGTSLYDALFLASTEGPLVEAAAAGRKAVIVFSDCVDSTSSYRFGDIVDAVERSGASVYVMLFDTRGVADRLLTQPDGSAERVNFSRSQLDRFYDAFAPESPDRDRDPDSYTALERLEINDALYTLARKQAEQVATRTGGRVYPVRTIGDLGSAYRAIAAELRTRYSIGYYPTNTRHDGTWRTLRIEVPKQKGAVVVARPGYWAPKD